MSSGLEFPVAAVVFCFPGVVFSICRHRAFVKNYSWSKKEKRTFLSRILNSSFVIELY